MKIKNDPSGIDFNNLSNNNVVWNIPLDGNNYRLGSQKNEFEYADEDGVFPIINAVEIDWNGAQVAGKTLNTTGEVLSLIGDNNTDIENVASSLQNHSHPNYATTDYVKKEINNASGGSGLDVENFREVGKNYNLLVAPEGSKYTEIGSLNNGSDWCSNLCAGFEEDGSATLYSDTIVIDNIVCNKNANIPHSHSNYATTNHSHGNYTTSIEYLEDQITYLSYRIVELEELIGGGSVTPTIPDITGVTVKVTGGIYGNDGKTGTLNDKYTMRQFSDGSTDTLGFVLTANPSNANATFQINYDDNKYGEISDTLVKVTSNKIDNGLHVIAKMNSKSEKWIDGDWTRYKVEASNSESLCENMLFLQLSYIYGDATEYFYVGQTQPTAVNYDMISTKYSASDYPSTFEYIAPARNYVYVLVTEDKEVTNIVDSNGMTNGFSEINSGITGYRLYKTDGGIASGGKIIITIA